MGNSDLEYISNHDVSVDIKEFYRDRKRADQDALRSRTNSRLCRGDSTSSINDIEDVLRDGSISKI